MAKITSQARIDPRFKQLRLKVVARQGNLLVDEY